MWDWGAKGLGFQVWGFWAKGIGFEVGGCRA